jgi:uncharacterized protein CbrC (UPF0167 family)
MLPTFRYHPDPIKTGSVRPSDSKCAVCGLARGFTYHGPVYGEARVRGRICPWCIVDGTAAERFSISFADDWALAEAGIAPEIIAEVVTRTPGFTSWQGEEWLSHCNDACEFHGDLPPSDLRRLADEVQGQLWPEMRDAPPEWEALLSNYSPGGDPSIYWFRCRHCGKDLFATDCS